MERQPAYNPNFDNNYNSINSTYNATPYISNFQNSYNYLNSPASTTSQYYAPLQSINNMKQNYYPPIPVNNTCQHCYNKESNESNQMEVETKKTSVQVTKDVTTSSSSLISTKKEEIKKKLKKKTMIIIE
jgi:hypothetical protein